MAMLAQDEIAAFQRKYGGEIGRHQRVVKAMRAEGISVLKTERWAPRTRPLISRTDGRATCGLARSRRAISARSLAVKRASARRPRCPRPRVDTTSTWKT